MSLARLLAEVRDCRLCESALPHEPRPVVQADARARILVAGQAPGRNVHASGRPFDDVSGDVLRKWLGVTPEEFYDAARFAIVPMGLCYPGTGPGGDLPPRPECAPAWRERVLKQLPRVELTLVIGRYALTYHIGGARRNVADLAKDWRTYWPGMVPMPHPSPRNRLWLRRHPWFEAEVVPRIQARVRELLEADARLAGEAARGHG